MKKILLGLGIALLSLQAHAATIAYGTTGVGGAISDLYQVGVTTGTTTFIGTTGYAINSIAYYNGTLYGTQRLGGDLLSINTSTGVATAIGPLGTNITSMAIDASGNAFGWSESVDAPYTIALGTGAATLLGSGITSASHGLAFLGTTLYFHNYDGSVYTIDTGTGGATFVGNTGLGRHAIDGDVNPDDSLYYGLGVANFGAPNTINIVDLPTATFVGSVTTDVDLHTLTFAGTIDIPEPAAITLVGLSLGLGGIALKRRRRAA